MEDSPVRLPMHIFADYMKGRGIYSICSVVKNCPRKGWRNPINRIVNYLIYDSEKFCLVDDIEEGKVIQEINGLKFLKKFKGTNEWGDVLFCRKDKIRDENKVINLDSSFIENLEDCSKDYPIFIIDLRFFEKLTEKEKLSLVTQIECSLGLIKDYLLEDCLVLANTGEKQLEEYSMRKNYKEILKRINNNIYSMIDFEKTIVLDPYGDIEVDENLIKKTKYFIIGGIVDIGNRLKGLTSQIFPEVTHAKITYEGKIGFVPKEINHIVEIIINIKIKGKNVKESIENVQPKRYRKNL